MCGSWGLNQVAIKVALWGIPPALQMGARSLVAALLVFAWCLIRRQPLFARDGTLWPGLAVGLMFAVEFALIFWGLQITTAARGVLFIYVAPFVVASVAHFVLGEVLNARKLAGLACAFSGLVLALPTSCRCPLRTLSWATRCV